MSLLLLFLSDEPATTDDFCNLLLEDGGKLLTEAGEDIIGENCVPDATASTQGRPGRRIQPAVALLIYWDDEEALIVMET